jgi:hypothetical protein
MANKAKNYAVVFVKYKVAGLGTIPAADIPAISSAKSRQFFRAGATVPYIWIIWNVAENYTLEARN